MSSSRQIQYVTGDATLPKAAGPVIIAHVCNDVGAWGSGFVLAISKRWKEPETQFRRWHKGTLLDPPPFALGEVQFVPVAATITIANMIAQHGIRSKDGIPPIRYPALGQALAILADEALRTGACVHMPRIGCGLAGGTWDRVEPLIQTQLLNRGIAVTVYDFPQS